ncbi:hypothetical protein LCGC14_2789620 [marine sediment metagenome]|uniref:Uncharacterized protein n=1 Tax=marine sediment metagenome TaxID=412755 RepID=A0A0F8YQV0_9ZZZZ
MHKPMTKDELESQEGILPEDKLLIEEAVGFHTGCDEEPIKEKALRGYLVALWEELEPDDDLRESLGMTAANWSDGWGYCLAYGEK